MPIVLNLPRIKQMEIDTFSWLWKENNGEKLAAKEAFISRRVDKSSLDLIRSTFNGETYKEAVVILDGSSHKVLFKLKMAFINNYQTEDGIIEFFTLKFTTMVVEERK